MKKLIALALILCVVLGLTACGNSGDSTSQTQSPANEATGNGDAEPDGSQEETEPEEGEPQETAGDGADWQYIQDKGELVIGITYFEPMNYLEANGDLTGFETEFAQAVCQILGVEPVFQEIQWSSKEIELNAKNIDCIWNGMTIDEERAANMTISQPYMENKQVLVVKSENADAMAESVDDLDIVAEAGSAGETVCEGEAFFSAANFVPVDTQAKALMEVASGTADGCVIDYVTSIGMIGEGTDFSDLVVVDSRGYGAEEYGIAVRKGEDEVIGRINDAINQLISDGTLASIAEKYKLEDLLIA